MERKMKKREGHEEQKMKPQDEVEVEVEDDVERS